MEISVPVQKNVALKPFIELVKIVARVFYDDYTTNSDNQQKSSKTDNRGTAVVVLDALTRRQWVREEDLAKELKMNAKGLRKIIRHFEEQKLITRDHRKETAKRARMHSVTDGRAEDRVKLQTQSYCCLDFSQIYDIVRFKLHRIKKMLKQELEDKDTVQEYVCPNCQRKYSALDALRLIFMEDDSFHCEKCNSELVMECNNITSGDIVDGDANARKLRRGKIKDLLQKMEVQLKPLMDQINRVKDLPVPEYETLRAWETRVGKAARANPNDSSRSQVGNGSTQMPFLGETEVEVNLGEGKEDGKSGGGESSMKVIPPWMIRSGMNLTGEQRGEMSQEGKVDGGSGEVKHSDDNISATGDVENNDFKEEYLRAWRAALLARQELAENPNQQESQMAATSSDRKVGMKSKREKEDEEDVEWVQETPVTASGNYKVDTNVEEEDDIDWE